MRRSGYAGEIVKRPPSGLLLVRGAADAARSWTEGGLTTVRVVPLRDGWTAVVPVTATSAAPPPYDNSVSVLLARPVPHSMRPCIGVAVVGDQALVAVTPARWRAVQRWVAWRPGTGLVRPGGLPTARLADLVHLANSVGAVRPGAVAALAEIVHDPAGDARSVLRGVLDVLGLPGGELLERLQLLEDRSDPHDPRRPASPGSTQPTSTVPGTHLVEPSPSRVAAFTRMVTEDASWREETGGRP